MVSISDTAMPRAAIAQTLPDPYNPPQRRWAKLPGGKPWGASAGIEFGPYGELWAIDRCGANSCDGSGLPAVYQLDPRTGNVLKAIGAGLFAFPHGLHVDKDGNIWVTDPAIGKDGKTGRQVVKLSPGGKVLMRLGMAGMAGGGAAMFSNPGDVITAPDGSIFVIDGHGTVEPNLPPDTIARVIHVTKNGRFLKAWGSLGSGKGQFRNPHAVAFDSQGRLFVADRVNGRIQVFAQDGTWLTEYRGFGAPSGLAITPDDTLYAVDYNTEGRKGIFIGNAGTGAVTGFVPDDQASEGIAAGPDGTLYEATPAGLTRFTRKNWKVPACPRRRWPPVSISRRAGGESRRAAGFPGQNSGPPPPCPHRGMAAAIGWRGCGAGSGFHPAILPRGKARGISAGTG